MIQRDEKSKVLTCLNFCDASSLPAFLSGCHFKACNRGREICVMGKREINMYHFLVCLFDVLVRGILSDAK